MRENGRKAPTPHPAPRLRLLPNSALAQFGTFLAAVEGQPRLKIGYVRVSSKDQRQLDAGTMQRRASNDRFR